MHGNYNSRLCGFYHYYIKQEFTTKRSFANYPAMAKIGEKQPKHSNSLDGRNARRRRHKNLMPPPSINGPFQTFGAVSKNGNSSNHSRHSIPIDRREASFSKDIICVSASASTSTTYKPVALYIGAAINHTRVRTEVHMIAFIVYTDLSVSPLNQGLPLNSLFALRAATIQS